MNIKARVVKLEVKTVKTAPRHDKEARAWLERQIQAINDGTNPPREPWVFKPIPPDTPFSLACLYQWLNEGAERESRERENRDSQNPS